LNTVSLRMERLCWFVQRISSQLWMRSCKMNNFWELQVDFLRRLKKLQKLKQSFRNKFKNEKIKSLFDWFIAFRWVLFSCGEAASGVPKRLRWKIKFKFDFYWINWDCTSWHHGIMASWIYRTNIQNSIMMIEHN
jgi:hypothetical protein